MKKTSKTEKWSNRKKTSRFTFFVKNIVKNGNFQKRIFNKKDVHFKKNNSIQNFTSKNSKTEKWKNEK